MLRVPPFQKDNALLGTDFWHPVPGCSVVKCTHCKCLQYNVRPQWKFLSPDHKMRHSAKNWSSGVHCSQLWCILECILHSAQHAIQNAQCTACNPECTTVLWRSMQCFIVLPAYFCCCKFTDSTAVQLHFAQCPFLNQIQFGFRKKS